MQRWQDELTKHPLNTTIKQLLDILENDLQIEDPIIESERARFAKVVYFLRDIMKQLDPDITPFDVLDQINGQLQNLGVLQVAQSIVRGREVETFRDINTRLTPILSYVAQLRGSAVGADLSIADLKAATDAFERFSSRVEQRRRAFERAISEAEQKVIEAATVIQSFHEQVKVAGDSFQEKIASWTVEATTTFNEQKADFASAQAKNITEFASTLNTIKEDARAKLKTLFAAEETEAKIKQEVLENKLKEVVTDAEDRHRKILKLYDLVAVDSVTGGHKKIADREFGAAEGWRWATVTSIGITVAWLWFSLFKFEIVLEPERVFWLQIGKSISLTALLLSFAVYASKQAALHRMNERRARAFFLQVQAFDPFIESLPEPNRHELKQALSARIFGPDDPTTDKIMLENGDFKSLDRLFGIMEQLKKLMGK